MTDQDIKNPIRITYCPTPEAAAFFVAQKIIKEVKSNKTAILGLATGGTVIPVYKMLVEDYNKNHTDYTHIKTFNMDEYVGLSPIYIHESYRIFMNHHLFTKINIDLENTFFPSIEKPGEYDDHLNNICGVDLQLIGVGNNGHIAFNEPGSSITSKTRIITLTPNTIKANSRFFNNDTKLVPKKAITMGISSLFTAKKIICMITGAAKGEALKHMVAGKYDPNWPCSACLFHSDVEVVCDLEAATAAGLLNK